MYNIIQSTRNYYNSRRYYMRVRVRLIEIFSIVSQLSPSSYQVNTIKHNTLAPANNVTIMNSCVVCIARRPPATDK